MNLRTHWAGTWLVAERAIGDGWASRSFRIITGLMLLIGIASAVLPRLLAQDSVTYTLAIVEDASPLLQAQLEAAAQAGDFSLEIVQVADDAAAEQAVRDGVADVALTGSGAQTTLFVAVDGPGTFPAIVAQAVAAESTTEALAEAGLTPEQIAGIAALPPPEQVPVGRVADEDRAGVGYIVGIVLYLALILTGTSIATAVATEKSTRISEVLLAALRPTQLLVGTVLGVGLLGLLQVAALGVPVLVGLMIGGGLEVPEAAAGDVALGIAWFALGLLLYAFVFAAMGSLVEKVSEVSVATMPAQVVLIGSYILAISVTTTDPNSWASVAASLFPLSAPIVMPIRWASGLVPAWQLGLAMALTAAAAVALALLASRIYARGLATTGRRVKLAEALRD